MVIELFLILLLGACILVVLEKDLIRCLIFLSFASIFVIILVYLYNAPDVALTLAVVNGAASTILFLAVIKKIEVIGDQESYI
ncbi:MAG: Na(+)/H(+) antiporter subunit B [Thermoplasmatota archaeon]